MVLLAGAVAAGILAYPLVFDTDDAFDTDRERVTPAEPPGPRPRFEAARVTIPRSRLSVPRPADVPVIRVTGRAGDTSASVSLTSEVPDATVSVRFSPGYASTSIPPGGTRQVSLPPGCYRMTYSAPGYSTATDRQCLSAGLTSIRFYLVRGFG